MTVLDTAKSQIGYREGAGNRTKFGVWFGVNGVSWCAEFVAWVYAIATGIDLRRALTPNAASVDAIWQAARAKKWATTNPRPGDIVIFHFPGEHAGGNHTGILESATGSTVTTIDGNTGLNETHGGGVDRKTRNRSLVLGFIHVPQQAPPALPPAIRTARRPVLHEGDRGPDVAIFRNQGLVDACGQAIPQNDDYDALTALALTNVQLLFHLPVNGAVVDQRTWDVLELAFATKHPGQRMTPS